MAMTDDAGRGFTAEELTEFLTQPPIFAKIASTDDDGWPIISPVWFEWDGDSFLVVSKERTSMVRNLKSDPRCALLVDNPALPYKRVSVQGRDPARRLRMARTGPPHGAAVPRARGNGLCRVDLRLPQGGVQGMAGQTVELERRRI